MSEADLRAIDDLSRADPTTPHGVRWEALSDRVMGGVSVPTLARERVAGRFAQRLTGRVRLENNGGFLQMALDLDPSGRAIDASGWTGVRLLVFGNGEDYGLHLRTDAVQRPWQSYRQSFVAPAAWTEIDLPFTEMVPHRLEAPFDPTRLKRLGLVAIGRAFEADLSLGWIGFYR
ncbi:MAG: CIA30 family protein [Marivibrio sp.]|uniref:CIA30 family protein n=1 Tax=Marivibrio sp. TaxID=2039719 RepID=UPI0032ED1369